MVDMADRSPEFRTGFIAAILWLEGGDPYTWKDIPEDKEYVILEMKDGGCGDRTYTIPSPHNEPVHSSAGVVL
jgi:hypothetical protein